MDNLIELIIFLFIVYSIFNSFFGKKKQQQKPQPPIPGGEPIEDTPKKSAPRHDSIDVLEELFGFKLPKTGNEFPYPKPSDKNSDTTSWDPEEEFRLKISQKESKPNKQIERPFQNINYDKLNTLSARSKEKLVKSHTKSLIGKSKITSNRVALDIKKKLNNPAAIREMILISEILNKPKALRK